MFEQMVVFATLLAALVLFAIGRWRYDVVALLALLVVTLAGIVPAAEAFTGFGHPAVVTVAAVLVASRGLQNSGVVDLLAAPLQRLGNSLILRMAALTGLVAVVSAVMNNVGALALLLPVAVRMARRNGHPPSVLLMPLAFGSLLGGLITLIGTPPNLIIAAFRAQTVGEPFRMFDFSPVGGSVALGGVLFVVLIGWRLIPQRKGQALREELFAVEDYITEVRLPEESKIVGKAVRDVETATESDAVVVGLIRGERRLTAPSGYERLRAGDVLILEADAEALKRLVDDFGLEMVGDKDLDKEALGSEDVSVIEAVVTPGSLMERRSARGLNLHLRFGVNLLAVARAGARVRARLGSIRFQVGDVLLLQGPTETLQEVLPTLGCLPLAERGLRLGQPRRAALAIGIFGAALLGAGVGLVPVQVGFVAAGVGMVMAGLLTLREAYESVDGPVIILLGAMIPVGQALETTGGAQLIASTLLHIAPSLPPAATMTVLMVVTTLLSNIVNNAAAAVLMAPIAIGLAQGLGVSVDPFLMSVAVGASAAFLTPIGHQSNILVMGPGGYRFTDYWRMGLPLTLLVVALTIPLVMRFWPLGLAGR